MKKQIITIICALAFLITAGVGEAAKTKAKEKSKFQAPKKENVLIEEEKTNTKKVNHIRNSIQCGYSEPMRVAGYVTNPPFGWVTMIPASALKKEQYINAGFSYDLFTQLAKNLGLRVSNTGYPSYQAALSDLRKGKVDVIVGTYYDKRVLGAGTNLMFPGYFTNPILPLFVKGKEKPVQSWEDLRGLKGVVRQEEMIYSLIYNQIPKDLQIEQVSGSKAAFRKLLNGEADYMITSLYAGEAEVRRYKLLKEIYFSPKALVSPEIFFVFSSHTDCRKHKKKLAEELKKIIADKENYQKTLISYIDDWGMRFKDNPSLIEEMQLEKDKALHPEKYVNVSSDASDLIEAEAMETSDITDTTDTVTDSSSSGTAQPTAPTPLAPSGTAQPTAPTPIASGGTAQ